MNPKLEPLVTALESGEYEQAQSRLRTQEGGFCCLGVACDVFHKATGEGQWALMSDGWTFLLNGQHAGLPPNAVYEYFGLSPAVILHIEGGKYPDRAPEGHNDSGASFAAIAKALREL